MPSSAAEKAPKSAEGLPQASGSVQDRRGRREPQRAVVGALGVKVEGSASTGHKLLMGQASDLGAVFGTNDPDQANALVSQCLRALSPTEAGDAGESNDDRQFLLSIIHDLAPRDAVERMLAVQMAVTHVATIRAARSLATSKLLSQAQTHYTGFNKLTRSFAAQVEALRKHRTGGKQTVVVQHVNVAEGGQAIVGHVETGGVGAR